MSLFISDAWAEGAPAAGQGDPLQGILFLVGMIAIFYFLLIRPQQKRAKEHRQMVEALAKGDEIVTSGGLLGRIIEVGSQYVTVELGEGLTVRMEKQAVARVLPKGSLKAAEKE